MYTRQLIDSEGTITKRNLTTCKEIIENLSNQSHEWHSPTNGGIQAREMGEGSVGIALLNAKLETMDRSIKKINQTIHTIQVDCDNFSGAHFLRVCDLDENSRKKAQVYYSSVDKYDQDRG